MTIPPYLQIKLLSANTAATIQTGHMLVSTFSAPDKSDWHIIILPQP